MGHLQEAGFEVDVVDVPDMAAVKAQHGIAPELAGCHTAEVEGYLIEGHVPADVMRRMLAERPAIKGLSVPGMPIGSPGMEGPNPVPYEVLTFDEQGQTTVYERREP